MRPFSSAILSRRAWLRQSGALATVAPLAPTVLVAGAEREQEPLYRVKQGRIRQSVIHWCFQPMSVEELASQAARLGLRSVELVSPSHWPTLKKHGLICAISGSHGFAKGFAHLEEHAECLAKLRTSIDATAAEGWPNVITFSGFRRGLSTEEGVRNMVAGLKQIVGYAEQKKVTLCLEMLNSRVRENMKGHPDYFCDDIDLSVEICKQIGSDRMKVLFDIYHVQIMQGDVISRLQQHAPYIGHYHTAGVPGRAEIDDTQELNYAAVMRAIAETKYQGYVGQEFIPRRNPITSLSQAARICDV